MLDQKQQQREYVDALKRRVGKEPFIARIPELKTKSKVPCPFHGGDEGFGLFTKDGVWFATCRSACNKVWDAIGFVEAFDHVDFKSAVARLGGRVGKDAAPPDKQPKPTALTDAAWKTWGHEPTAEDIATFAASRKDATASVDVWRRLGCRVKDGVLGFPYRLTGTDGEVAYFTVKTRPLDSKDIRHLEGHCVNSKAFFNLDTVCFTDPVFVVEGEPDVAIMEQAGFRTVSVMNANHEKFDKAQLAILCEATHIYLIGDQGEDDPGRRSMDALAAALPADKVSRISFSDGKDVCALARIYGDGFAQRISELSEESLTPWVTKNITDVTPLLRLGDPLWIVDRMIPYKGVTIICSPQGGNKTTLALALAKAISNPIAHDFKFLGRGIMPHARRQIGSEGDCNIYLGARDLPILYVDRENPPVVIGSRLRRMGLLGDRNFLYWGDGDPHADTPDVTDPRLMEWMIKTGGVIVFDSLQDWYGDAKEIDNAAMVKLMHGFRRLARLGGGVIILHHVQKSPSAKATGPVILSDMSHFYRGGTGIVSIPDMAIAAVKDDESGELILGEIRFRLCPTWRIRAKVEWDGSDQQHPFLMDLGKPYDTWGRNPIRITLVEDLDATALHAQVADHREQTTAKRKAAKESERDTDAAILEAELLKDNTLSLRQLGKLTGIRRHNIVQLLERKGWRLADGVWEKAVAVNEAADGDSIC